MAAGEVRSLANQAARVTDGASCGLGRVRDVMRLRLSVALG